MAKLPASLFPTKFAVSMARKCDMYSAHNPKRMAENNKDYVWAVECHIALTEFQQFALIAELDEAMVAYIDFDNLNELQLSYLEKIYKHTRVWVKGQVVENLLDNIDVEAKSASPIAKQIMDMTGMAFTEGMDKKDDSPSMGLNITLNGLPVETGEEDEK